MKKITALLLSAIVLFALFFFVRHQTKAAGEIEITTNSTEHTILYPYEKSFLFVATMKNNSGAAKRVQINPAEVAEPEDWHILEGDLRYELGPGESANHVIVFESGTRPETFQKGVTVVYPLTFDWETGREEITVTVNSEYEAPEESKDISRVKFNVFDKDTNEAVENFSLLALFPSGAEEFTQNCSDSTACEMDVTSSGEYLEQIVEQYGIEHASTGYFLQVSAVGYKSHFESDFLPQTGYEEKTVHLAPLDQVGEYEAIKTIESGFSIWWIKASEDEKLFAISQGTHGMPGVESPAQTKVLLANDQGEVLWENVTGGECWGADISPNGEYVAAGCHDEKIYVWDKAGNEKWTYANSRGGQVRWVKFSPDSSRLLAGPVEDMPEHAGLFDVSSGSLLWSFNTGGFLREGRFSKDGQTVYLASANGSLHAVETSTGNKKWQGSGDYYIPFILGYSESEGTIIASGKGRAFVGLDLQTGEQKWKSAVDQTVTAGEVAEDGSVIASTVGGVSYGVDPDGEIAWARHYGGVGHNGVFYPRNGEYVLFGGPNPTLLDRDGNVLWQKEEGQSGVEMSGVAEVNDSANGVWMSKDASLLIVGQGDGDIVFYKGEVKQGENEYDQMFGVGRNGRETEREQKKTEGIEVEKDDEEDRPQLGNLLAWGGIGLVGVAVVVGVGVGVWWVVKKQKAGPVQKVNGASKQAQSGDAKKEAKETEKRGEDEYVE